MITVEEPIQSSRPSYESLGELIAKARGKTSGELVARRSGVSRRTLTKIEQGDPSVAFGSYGAVARELGMPWMFELLSGQPDQGRTVPRYYLTGASALSLTHDNRLPALWYSSSLANPKSWQISGAGIDGTGELLGAQDLWDATDVIQSLGVTVGNIWAATHERALFDLLYHFYERRGKPLPNIQVSDVDDVVDLAKIQDWIDAFKPFLSPKGAAMMTQWLQSEGY